VLPRLVTEVLPRLVPTVLPRLVTEVLPRLVPTVLPRLVTPVLPHPAVNLRLVKMALQLHAEMVCA